MKLVCSAVLASVFVSGTFAMADDKKETVNSVHDLKVKSLDGKEVDLSKYKNFHKMV